MVMKEIPKSEIQAKFFADTGEECGETLAKNVADFRPLISRKSGRKKFHEKSSTFSTRDETKLFHREILRVGAPNQWVCLDWEILGVVKVVLGTPNKRQGKRDRSTIAPKAVTQQFTTLGRHPCRTKLPPKKF